jgi:hypothetical protein
VVSGHDRQISPTTVWVVVGGSAASAYRHRGRGPRGQKGLQNGLMCVLFHVNSILPGQVSLTLLEGFEH